MHSCSTPENKEVTWQFTLVLFSATILPSFKSWCFLPIFPNLISRSQTGLKGLASTFHSGKMTLKNTQITVSILDNLLWLHLPVLFCCPLEKRDFFPLLDTRLFLWNTLGATKQIRNLLYVNLWHIVTHLLFSHWILVHLTDHLNSSQNT